MKEMKIYINIPFFFFCFFYPTQPLIFEWYIYISKSYFYFNNNNKKAWEFQHPNFKYNRKDLLEGIKVIKKRMNSLEPYY